MYKILLHGILTIYSDEVYKIVEQLAEEDELFPLISDFLNRKISSDTILSKLDELLEVVKKPTGDGFKVELPVSDKNTKEEKVNIAVAEISGTAAAVMKRLGKMRKK